ncbi:aldehyde dehydrogenase family protein, partial [Streptomyces sp. GbtcB7]|uniref:aldehyde dehydrogenase family protein n=1 Tax=Streptomyces sp. GbtcB7 TaxID=2824752 RepID=UPI001C2F59E2
MEHVRNAFYIGGRWRQPLTTEVNTVVSAATEQTIGQTPLGGAKDIDSAVAAAREAFEGDGGSSGDDWSGLGPAERADALERFAAAIEARADEIARLVSRQNGMPMAMSVGANAIFPAAILRYYAGLARELEWEEPRKAFTGGITRVRREPVGVVGA